MAKFELVTPLGALRMAAPSSAARDAWVAGIQAHIHRSSPSARVGGALSLMAASARRMASMRLAADAAAVSARDSLVAHDRNASQADMWVPLDAHSKPAARPQRASTNAKGGAGWEAFKKEKVAQLDRMLNKYDQTIWAPQQSLVSACPSRYTGAITHLQ